jgi:hypothetical protein
VILSPLGRRLPPSRRRTVVEHDQGMHRLRSGHARWPTLSEQAAYRRALSIRPSAAQRAVEEARKVPVTRPLDWGRPAQAVTGEGGTGPAKIELTVVNEFYP